MKSYTFSFLGVTVGLAVVVSLFALALSLPAFADAKESNDPRGERVFVLFDEPVGDKERGLVQAFGGDIKYSYSVVNAIAAIIPEGAIEGLSHNPRVLAIEPDSQVEAVDVELDNSWGVKRVDAGDVHTSATPIKGAGVKVGIIDSGVNYLHPDLNDNFDPLDLGYDFYYYDEDPMDVYGHGTHVAGTTCAEDENTDGTTSTDPKLGVVGVAPECDLYSLRVLNDDGVGYWSDIIAAVDYATGESVYLPGYWEEDVGAPEEPIQGPRLDVINLSLGKDRHPGTTVEQAFDSAYHNYGILIVAAAGNSGNSGGKNESTIYPAKFESVIAVAATNDSDTRATFSSTGVDVELAAPGVDVYSTWNDNEGYYNPQPVCTGTLSDINGDGEPDGECYKYGSGTSMASPHVAGTAALVIAAGIGDNNGNGFINDDVRTLLQSTAIDLGDSGRDIQYGYGLVDAFAAVNSIGPTDLPPTSSITNPTDDSTVSGSVTVSADATDNDAVVRVDFYLDGVLQSSDTSAPYEWVWDTTTSTEGSHIVSATAVDTASQETTDSVTVNVDNTNEAPVADAGPDQSTNVNDIVNFDGSGSTDDRGITSYDWDFGDGTTSTGEMTSHTYTTVGTYTVTLTVTDTDGVTDSDTAEVTVTDPPAEPTALVVDSIGYATDGGRFQDKHLHTTPLILDDFGSPIDGASVSILLEHDSGSSWPGSGTTGTDGTVTFSFNNAPSGCYTTTITALSAEGLTWDGTTPDNQFCK